MLLAVCILIGLICWTCGFWAVHHQRPHYRWRRWKLLSQYKSGFIIGGNLAGVNCTGKYLYGAYFSSEANLEGAVFLWADLRHAHFYGVNLKGANFGGAKLVDADFTNADLSFANFSDADLTGAKFDRARMEQTKLTGAIQ